MASIPFQSYSNDITMVELQEHIDMYYLLLCVVKHRYGKGQRDPLLLVEFMIRVLEFHLLTMTMNGP